MRVADVRDDARGLGSHDHVCWVFDSPAEFADRSVEYLGEGLDAGDRVVLIAGGRVQADGILAGLPGVDRALASGAASAAVLTDIYGDGSVVEPERQVSAYAAATAQAVADGFRGLRVAVEATGLVRTERQREAFARYEALVDRLMAAEPFSAMCGYSRAELGDDAVTEIACVHPSINPGATPFRVFATLEGTGLAGELDASTRDLFTRTLHRSIPAPATSLVMDIARLDFVDHRSLQAIDDFAGRHGVVAELRNARTITVDVAALLQLQHVRVVPLS